MNPRQRAKMDLRRLAKAMNGTVNNGWVNIRGPHHSKGDRSLGIRLDPGRPGRLQLHSFAGDDPADCAAYVEALLRQVAVSRPIRLDLNEEAEPKRKAKSTEVALRLWSEGEPIVGTPAAVYLSLRRCAPTTGMAWPQDLRFHPACPFGPCRFPALIARTRDVVTGEPTGIHRTALSDDGATKRVMPGDLPSKMTLGCASGAAIHLGNAGALLGIAEGIETALSAQKIFKVPVWAALSASGIGSFAVIHGLSRLFVFADNDGPGRAAARTCQRRYRGAGIEVQIRYPSEHGTDWNDYLLRG
jgi:putative DNA primase/helicase